MYDINPGEITDEFRECWFAAGKHLESMADQVIWLRAHLSPPMIEHLSFRLGNKIFFIQIYDVDGQLTTPNNNIAGLVSFAMNSDAIGCLMPMFKRNGVWRPAETGWGLNDVLTGHPIVPEEHITDEVIEMSNWEIQDAAVTIMKNKLEQDGFEIMSWQSNPEVYPSIWFADESGPMYVVVGAGRYPLQEAPMPPTIKGIIEKASRMSDRGFFSSIVLANADDPFDPTAAESGNFLPLLRGSGMKVFGGELVPLVLN